MLLRANKFRKDKESDCRRNELGSRIFVGRVFGDYAECLHFYPSFSYGRIIAGQSRGVVRAPWRSHLPAVRAVSGIYEGVLNTAKNSRRALRNEKKPAVSRETEGFQRKTRGEYRKMVKGKEKFALWITPECKQLVDDCYADDQCQSRSEYIEKAILFYTGFLYAEKADRYLPRVLQQILSGTLDRFAERIGRQLFKLAVEQNVNNHILASDTDIDARSYQKMRGLSMDEVKRTNGRIDFEDALLSERGV